jgi:hypothetical protein
MSLRRLKSSCKKRLVNHKLNNLIAKLSIFTITACNIQWLKQSNLKGVIKMVNLISEYKSLNLK